MISTLLRVLLVAALICVSVAALPLSSHAADAAAAQERTYLVEGTVTEAFKDGEIVISHEEIPDYMPAMTMPFNTTSQEAAALKVGDRIRFRFTVGEESKASGFVVIGRRPAEPQPASNASAPARRLRPGDALPPFSLRSEQDQPLGAEYLSGHYTVLTFVFTRCPVPEFCPLIMRKMKEVEAGIEKDPALDKVQLLAVTLDPEFDTPAVLKEYAAAKGATSPRWTFATGESAQISQLTKAFTVRTERTGAQLDHTLATAVLSPEGRVIDIWRGNAWKPTEILEALRTAAK